MEQIKENARLIFSDYLQSKNGRKTAERFEILSEVYDFIGHFDVDTLYKLMLSKKYLITKATIYNTLELLCECSLVWRYNFNLSKTVFESSLGKEMHSHLICTKCGHITDIENNDVNDWARVVAKKHYFDFTRADLNIYGKCKKCK